MPDIKQLISLQFDSTGCTSNYVYKLGDVSFDAQSAVENKKLKCAYFPLYNDSGLYLNNSTVNDRIVNGRPFAIYFKYRAYKGNLSSTISPIISYRKDNSNDSKLFLAIVDKKYFTLYTRSTLTYSSFDISYTFDNDWHTFYLALTQNNQLIITIDGRINKTVDIDVVDFDFANNIYIGYHTSNNVSYSFGAYLDDFNIFDNPIYTSSFVPPTNYIGNKDMISNYFMDSKSPEFDQEITDTIEQVRTHTVDRLNNNQLGWLPRRANLTWHTETEGYFRNGEYEVIPRMSEYTYITVMEINQPLVASSQTYCEGNLLTLMDTKKVYPLMVFVNGYLVKLSQIYFIKSHDRYTLKLTHRNPRYSDPVETFDIVVLPFAVRYEEDYGERADLSPLYSFSADGRFTVDDVNIYYYIDEDREPHLKQIGIREHVVSDKQFAYNKNKDNYLAPDNLFLRFIYKYGVLELVRFADDGLGAYMKFDSTYEHSLGEVRYNDLDLELYNYRHPSTTYQKGDTVWAHGVGRSIPSYIRLRAMKTGTTLDTDRFDDFVKAQNEDEEFIVPGDTIAVYNGSALLDPHFYSIVGHNLLYINNVYEAGIRFGRNVTIQKVADSKLSFAGLMNSEAITMKTVTVQATVSNQSIFRIPQVMDEDGYEYHRFLLFKGHVLMEDENRYSVDTKNNTIRFLSTEDFVPKGRNITFLFIKYNKASAMGNYYTKPIFIHTRPDENGVVTFDPPNDLYVTKNNCVVFVNDTFVSPYRMQFIDGKSIKLLKDPDFNFTSSTNVTIVFLAILNTLEEGITDRDKLIIEQIKRGNRFIFYDLGVPKKYKLTIDNFLCFDETGKFIPDLIGRIFNYNVVQFLKTSTPLEKQVRYLTCLYRDDSLENKANILKYENEAFIKEYLKGRQEFYEMDQYFDKVIADFNFTHSYDLAYGENLANSLDYIMDYDKNKIDSIYEKKAKITRKDYDAAGMNKNLIKNTTTGNYEISIPRDEYYTNVSRTYPLFFNNGKLSTDWHLNSTKDMNYVKLSLPVKISASDKIESLDFHGMSNFLIPLTTMARANVNNSINSDIFARMVIGEEYSKHFYAKIGIKEYLNKDFGVTLEVVPDAEYVEFKTDVYYDIITCSIIPAPDYEISMFTTIEVEVLPAGTTVDLNDYIRAYDFSATIDVPDSHEVIIEN